MNQNKIKVLIVDDEELIRKLIVSSLDWAALNMEIIGEAVSGLEALAFMEDLSPDILFTDIKMPYMDGLELGQLVAQKYPHIKIVILTAFREFDYAQESIRIGVSHFLLKPINRTELKTTVLKLCEEIEEERKQWFEFDHLKKILQKNQTFLRERFLLEFMENSTFSLLAERQISYYYPNEIPAYIQVTILETCSPYFLEQAEEERILQDMKNLEFVRNYLKNNPHMEVLADKDHHLILFSYSPVIQMVSLCEQIQRSIQQTSGFDISFGIGNGYTDFYKMSLSFHEGMESLKYSRYTPNQPIVIYQNDIHLQNSAWSLSQNLLEDVTFYIKAGLSSQLNDILPALYLDEQGNLLSLDYARILSMSLLSSAINVANSIGIPINDLFEQDNQSFIQILIEPTSAELRAKTITYLSKLTASIATFRSNKSKTILWDILQYIKKEMNNPDLSLSTLADKFHMNDSYLSRSFKKELGFSFSKYLNRIRMEYAIQLLNSTDMKAYQIAEAVGIPDAYYFSNCFKKYTGKSIRDYRKGNS
ncbi:response regulator transcription factor [Anaerocolumna jejuensis]|uniref:response regulator transcription factor n=1 Tax=Anaerocolumna jejuensis TaxID=259063 RepID=UPI003F7CA8A1